MKNSEIGCMKITLLTGYLDGLYVFVFIGTCVLFVGWKSKKTKSGKRDFRIGGFLLAWLIFLALAVAFYILAGIAMHHLK